jgi:hypothetical protein
MIFKTVVSFVDGKLIPKIHEEYWRPYLAIQAAVDANPGDINL